MKAQTIQSAQEFLNVVGDELLVDEIRHNLTFGVAERVSQDSHIFGAEDPWFITVEDGGQICATAIRTPPHRLILAHLSGNLESLSHELVRSVHLVDPVIPGVVGDKEIVESFTQLWCATYRVEVIKMMAQRIYQLIDLVEPKYAEGRLRHANLDDEEIVISWAAAFHNEALGDELPRDHYQRYRERILSGDIYLWDNKSPMSMAAKTRPTRSGISIGDVYTPPELRNLGYATSCVAALCKSLLSKYDFCVLYTDLSNPTSNSIYKKIGFVEYCDSVHHTYSRQNNTV